ncbi:1-deoxy-D-xylulose-5-phosphate reductoisomerase [Dielma fastidiosa]|uniref:1-deoxy-D-xylulose 5-phosphate reductoisomerase n=1 Tax=Dielma fastidiosa TaxID=1034346 RepID=A0AB35UMA1_9FIRM|nr:1-deoxy-D-xylulose-5-phosphate reductoisomerase [Dielma fastidiosa]MDY5167878.1 1-deoxy-D-xylulose-5-phosphate reductoisomerase [Dielma fastidiosa]
MKQIILLGASGSIGEQTLDVIRSHPELFELAAFSVRSRLASAYKILDEFKVRAICVKDEQDADEIRKKYPHLDIHIGDQGLLELAALPYGDTLVNALVGFVGLLPTLKAIECRKDIALANKETLIVGGKFVKAAVKEYGVSLKPIDSEHSAIFQCLQGNAHGSVEKLIITASGGSFRDRSRDQLQGVTVKEALSHPNWSMGAKITIDSATMMNKGFEVIEAHYLFDIDYDKIEVLLHRESIVHSLVQYCDHALMAQLGTADMRLPIQYALTHPARLPLMNSETLDLAKIGTLHFEKADFDRYPLLGLAYKAGRLEGNACAVMNAANEEAVALFLAGKINFLDIETYVFKAVESIEFIENATLEDIIRSDGAARAFVNEAVKGAV